MELPSPAQSGHPQQGWMEPKISVRGSAKQEGAGEGRAFPPWLPGAALMFICFGKSLLGSAEGWFVSELPVGSNVLSITEGNKPSWDNAANYSKTPFSSTKASYGISSCCAGSPEIRCFGSYQNTANLHLFALHLTPVSRLPVAVGTTLNANSIPLGSRGRGRGLGQALVPGWGGTGLLSGISRAGEAAGSPGTPGPAGILWLWRLGSLSSSPAWSGFIYPVRDVG